MTYNIVIVANEEYLQHAAVMLCSLFENNKNKIFDIYLLTDGILRKSESRLKDLCVRYNSNLIVKNPEQELGETLGINLKELPVGQWNTMMYYKLFIPVMLPAVCDRCLFLDVDMVINDDIELLYNWDFNKSVIAAAEDMPDCNESHKPRIGLTVSDFYINSGVMVCNLDEWRRMEFINPIFDYVKRVSNIIVNEQDVLALYFRGRLSFLPIRWNMTTFYFLRNPKIFDKYIQDLKESQYNPGIIHFAAPIKPWYKDCTHPYKNKYRYFLKLSCWPSDKFKNYRQVSFIKRIKFNIIWILNNFNIKKDPYFLCLLK